MLRASAHALVVTPTGDNDEVEKTTGFVVVQNTRPADTILRGVVEHVGCHVPEGRDDPPLMPGHVVHYRDFIPLADRHIVPGSGLIAWEDDE